MKLDEYVRRATAKLARADIPTARLDCLVLIEDALRRDRSWLLAHLDHPLDESIKRALDTRLKRRAKHEPLAYIRGKSEFYGREFIVNPHTLEPRPESETMIDLLLQQHPDETQQTDNTTDMLIIDIGTGSGCLAITAQLLYPQARVVATDIDALCLSTAKENAHKNQAHIEFLLGDLLEPVSANGYKESNCFVLANLPYVPDSHTINAAAMYEPKHALFGGEDGLDYYRRLFAQADQLSAPPRSIFTESLPSQHDTLTQIAGSSGYRPAATADFIIRFDRK